jgi:hypothetical protein
MNEALRSKRSSRQPDERLHNPRYAGEDRWLILTNPIF